MLTRRGFFGSLVALWAAPKITTLGLSTPLPDYAAALRYRLAEAIDSDYALSAGDWVTLDDNGAWTPLRLDHEHQPPQFPPQL